MTDNDARRKLPRVVMLITGLGCGGAETQMVRLAVELASRGWDIRILAMTAPDIHWAELESARIPVVSLRMRRGHVDPRALLEAVRILREWRPDVLTCFLFHAIILGRIAGRLARVPVVISSIRNEWEDTRARHYLLRWTNWLTDLTTVNSMLAAGTLVRRKVVRANQLQVVPNAIEPGAFHLGSAARLEARQEFHVGPDEFLWIAIGRLEEQKDYPTLLDALALLKGADESWRLWIVGQGTLERHLKSCAHMLGIDDRVTFLGLRRDVPRLLAAADALVLSSAWEGSPNSVLEALDAGKPVVSTGVGGGSRACSGER